MAKTHWHIVTFPGGEPSWSRFDGTRLIPGDPPGKESGPVLLLLPDDYFFFILASAPRSLRERNIHNGLRLKMRHSFPAAVHGQEQGSFRLTPNDVLGFSAHPALRNFIANNQALIESADVVSTSFIVTLAAARSRNLDLWVWENGQGPKALVKNGELHYFRSGREELDKRKSLLEAEREPPIMTLEESLAALYENQVRPAKLRLPLKGLQSSRELEPRFWTRVLAGVLLAGVLFCAGEYFRLSSVRKDVRVYKNAIDELYKSVLGEDLGSDPYGTLLYRLDQRRGKRQTGVDILGLLTVLSDNSPESFKVEGINYNGGSGGIRALISTFDQLDAMLERLGKNKEYKFTLEQASNTKEGVLLNVNFVKQ